MKRKLLLLTTTLVATIVLLTSCSKDDGSSKEQPPKQEEPKQENPKPEQDEIIIFQDALAESICVKNFDKNSDGKISKSEAASVSDIGTIFKKTEITSLDELQYFTNLTSIGEECFSLCKKLVSVKIPDGIANIGTYSFLGCNNLTSITIPQSVVTIGNRAFEGCI